VYENNVPPYFSWHRACEKEKLWDKETVRMTLKTKTPLLVMSIISERLTETLLAESCSYTSHDTHWFLSESEGMPIQERMTQAVLRGVISLESISINSVSAYCTSTDASGHIFTVMFLESSGVSGAEQNPACVHMASLRVTSTATFFWSTAISRPLGELPFKGLFSAIFQRDWIATKRLWASFVAVHF